MQDSRDIATLIGMAQNARLKLHSESCSSTMALRAFLSGIARNETTALAFLRDKEVFEKQLEVRCARVRDNEICGGQMYEGNQGGAIKKIRWRCCKKTCNGSHSRRGATVGRSASLVP